MWGGVCFVDISIIEPSSDIAQLLSGKRQKVQRISVYGKS